MFLDRDDTLIKDLCYFGESETAHIEILPGVVEGLKQLMNRGFRLIVISNQGGISKGEYSREDVERFHVQLQAELTKQGASLDEIYYCPHHSDREACLCRKPLPLMIQKALARFDIDPASSWMIGDAERDVEAGRVAGLQTILIESNSDLREVLEKIG